MSERAIEEYICLNADKTLRELQTEIRANFNMNKSLKWISKAKKEYQAADPEFEATDVEHYPEIIKLKKEYVKLQWQKKILLEKAGVKTTQELKEEKEQLSEWNDAFYSTIKLLTRKLEKALREDLSKRKWANDASCPNCGGEFLFKTWSPTHVKCFVCGKEWKLKEPI